MKKEQKTGQQTQKPKKAECEKSRQLEPFVMCAFN